MSGNIIVIEGTDGSGKSTQLSLLCDRLSAENIDFRKITFPRYSEPSSALLKMYLNGEFGQNPNCVNPYAASTFFAVDRYASYKTDWEEYFMRGGTVICDRYTTSNAVHQATKLPIELTEEFLAWLFDFEYNLLGIPAPTKVFFLDMPPECSLSLIQNRQGSEGDIHEKDHEYLAKCRARALDLCKSQGWKKIDCAINANLRTIEDINDEICKEVWKLL